MNTTRRQMLAGAVAVGGAAALAPAAFSQATGGGAIKGVGLQLYTIRAAFEKDPVAALERVAAIGYREVEYGGGGYDKLDPAMLRKTQDRLGLTAPSLHVGYQQIVEQPDQVIERARVLGASVIVVPYAEAPLREAAAWRGLITGLNRFGERSKKAGIQLAYHNHDFEFTVKHDGRSLYDLMIAGRDPALLKFELDLFWTIAAGQDVNALIDRLAGDIVAYHVKDRTKDGVMVSVGAGVIDFAAIFKRNAKAGVRHLFVENDFAATPYRPDEFPSIEFSYATMKALGY
ncbi:sugar phosphate isomerase/epimerase [Sphingomonas sp. BGYR3]|uniref:sugar phosphate isomerase/epimerase family protein n=1 Tax=Sphingomonas sp. BGYR3 TaxID=2975483 RepID=UPI0021A28E4C|nr:sugar phosphate isomerase/epimerase [Sphingomonas sp. BGYR3]MDG5488057.1 sugar phosphate isomerase/epimerase [Sphingomonas sp. BGYR3]